MYSSPESFRTHECEKLSELDLTAAIVVNLLCHLLHLGIAGVEAEDPDQGAQLPTVYRVCSVPVIFPAPRTAAQLLSSLVRIPANQTRYCISQAFYL